MEIKSENEQKSGYEVLAETEERVILFAAAVSYTHLRAHET